VDWYPWGAEALAAAREQDKPIFLSIGYAACHWCHVMERESFEDEATADDLRRDFIAIKVDREERPDLDQVYMAAVQQMTGGGGWPMSVFLTPDGKPFYGGTYFPSEPHHGLPAFRQVLAGVSKAWHDDRAAIEASGRRLVEAIVGQERPARAEGEGAARAFDVPADTLERAVLTLEVTFDAARGGWGGAPKFPPSMALEFLLRTSAGPDARPATDSIANRALAMARRTLDSMADGGIRDQLGGGFHRYSTDARWLVPHFEQMLYDNAQLARVYLHAWQLTGESRYRDVACGVLDFMAERLMTEDGAFAASLDADTGGVEGATFTWTASEVREVVGGTANETFSAAYGVTEAGNWEGRTILSRVASDAELARRSGTSERAVREELTRARGLLLDRRGQRPQPGRDDKALAAWNGLAIAAFADAAAALASDNAPGGGEPGGGEPGGDEPGGDEPGGGRLPNRYRVIAERAASAILAGLRTADGRLRRSWKDGRATADGVLEDYADLAEGFLSLYEATFDERWFVAAGELVDAIQGHFADAAGGFFDTADDAESLVSRPRDLQDNALPSGGAMAATVLLRLAALTGSNDHRRSAERALVEAVDLAPRHPTFFGQWLIALDLATSPIAEIAIVGALDDPATAALIQAARSGYRPHGVIAVAAEGAGSAVPLLEGRDAIGGRPTAYVCRDFACRLPVHDPAALTELLDEAGSGVGSAPWP
jgi:uncharacterized protein YyaL (SSP411 family)